MDSEKNGTNHLANEIIECLEHKGIRIESFIGKGGFSSVYKAISNDNQLAVKVIKLKEQPKDVRKQFLFEEIRIASTVKHEYIVKTHSVIELKNNFILIITQFADGGDLIDILDRNIPLEEPVVQRWFSQTVKAVEYLHSIGIAHRDIKPDNILIDNGVAKLTDFGYAHKSVDDDGNVILCADTCGTLEYLSPEQIRCILDDQPYDPFISDCYSLGVLLFLMVELYFPYECTGIKHSDEVLENLLNKQLKQKWEMKGKYRKNQNVITLLKQLLNPEVTKRVGCHQILCHPWIKSLVAKKNNDE